MVDDLYGWKLKTSQLLFKYFQLIQHKEYDYYPCLFKKKIIFSQMCGKR